MGIPLNSFEEKGKYFHSNIVFATGDYHQLIKDLKRDPKIKKLEVRGNQLFSVVEGREFISTFFDKSFFFIRPVIMRRGFEYWELGCWKRKKLIDFYGKIKDIANVELLKLKREFPAIFMQQAVPKLTKKQRDAFALAKQWGYYEYPRKISIKELSRRINVPRTTLQFHLRKAETKMLDVILE